MGAPEEALRRLHGGTVILKVGAQAIGVVHTRYVYQAAPILNITDSYLIVELPKAG